MQVKLRTPKIAAVLAAIVVLAACQRNVGPTPQPPVVQTKQAIVAKANRILVESVGLVNDAADAAVRNGVIAAKPPVLTTYLTRTLEASARVSEIQKRREATWNTQVQAVLADLPKIEPKFGNDPKYANIAATLALVSNSINTILLEVK